MGFESPNYTQIPNDLFDIEMQKMGYAELKVVLAICRYTFGYHKTERRISLTKLEAMTGLSRPAVLQGAKEAEDHGYIEKWTDWGVTLWVVKVLNQPVKLLNQISKVTLPPSIKETLKETTININQDELPISKADLPVTQRNFPRHYNKTDAENMKAANYRRYKKSAIRFGVNP